jgi:hypothetical protein
MSDTPNVGLPLVPEGTLDPAAGLNLALIVADALIQTGVISMALTAPPVGPSDGDMYIVAGEGGVATGAWVGEEDNLARYVAQGTFWQFYQAGSQVKFILNVDNDGFYKFTGGTGGSWSLAAGLGDAPSDGALYGRKDATWEEISLTLTDEQSSPTEVENVTAIIVGDGLVLSQDTAGIARLEAVQTTTFAAVITESGTSRNALPAAAGAYVRFTNAAAKEYVFDDTAGYTLGQEFHGRNVGAGDLEITPTTGMTINAPFGGSLVIPQDGTFTVKIVAVDGSEADLFGATEQVT